MVRTARQPTQQQSAREAGSYNLTTFLAVDLPLLVLRVYTHVFKPMCVQGGAAETWALVWAAAFNATVGVCLCYASSAPLLELRQLLGCPKDRHHLRSESSSMRFMPFTAAQAASLHKAAAQTCAHMWRRCCQTDTQIELGRVTTAITEASCCICLVSHC